MVRVNPTAAPFNPEMLVLRREALGLTQAQVAERLGISQAKLSKIEAGLTEPDLDLVEGMARALRRPIPFFHEKEAVYGPGVSEFYHRKRSSVGAKQIRQAHARINEDIAALRRLLRSADIDTSRLDALQDVDELTPGEAARAVRATLGVPRGPIKNLIRMIEDAGAMVMICDFPSPKIDGISRWVPGLPPLFFLNRAIPGDRQRLTLAHELGHVLLHRTPNEHMEEEANRFAAELLMPKAEIRADLGPSLTLDRLAKLKPYWRVSMQALLYRASELELVTERKARYMWMRLGKLGYRRREPAELDIPQEKPSLLRELFEVHQSEFGYGTRDLEALLLLEHEEICSRYGVAGLTCLEGDRPRLRLVT